MVLELDLAGMDGVLGRTVLPAGHVQPAEWAEVVGDELRYRTGAFPRDAKGLLDAFLLIEEPADIPAFVMRYGELALCRCGLQPAEKAIDHQEWPDRTCLDFWATGAGKPYFTDPVTIYTRLARRTKALLLAAGLLRNGDTPPMEVVAQATGRSLENMQEWISAWEGSLEPLDRAEYLRSLVADAVNDLMELTHCRPRLDWASQGPRLSVGWGTDQLLVLQLASAITGSKLSVCSTCGKAYERAQAAPAGTRRRHNYCEECKDLGLDARFMKQQQRLRKKGAAP